MGSSTFHNFVLRKLGSHTLSNSFGVAVVQFCALACVRACVSVSISCMRPSLQRLGMKIQRRWLRPRQEEAALCPISRDGFLYSLLSFLLLPLSWIQLVIPPPKHLLMSSEISHNNVGRSDSGRTLSGSPPASSPSLPPLDEFSLSARQWQLLFFKCIERTWGCTWVCVSCSVRACRQGSFRCSERKTRKDSEIKVPICEHRRKPIILLWL